MKKSFLIESFLGPSMATSLQTIVVHSGGEGGWRYKIGSPKKNFVKLVNKNEIKHKKGVLPLEIFYNILYPSPKKFRKNPPGFSTQVHLKLQTDKIFFLQLEI